MKFKDFTKEQQDILESYLHMSGSASDLVIKHLPDAEIVFQQVKHMIGYLILKINGIKVSVGLAGNDYKLFEADFEYADWDK